MPFDPAGLDVTVMGLGRFGGGVGVTRWLADRGARVLVTDRADASTLGASIDQLDDLVRAGRVRLHLGGHLVEDVARADAVVVNPAVPRPWDDELLLGARGAGVRLTTEIRLLTERLDRRRTIAVTGSAGKSTTTAMIHHLLRRAGHVAHCGGNIGGSLLPALDGIGSGDWIVLELSSAMLHWLAPRAGHPDDAGFSPHVAVLTNVAPNHLDWHGSFEHYAASKAVIFAHQQPGDHAVRGDDIAPPPAPIPLAVPGAHNQHNAVVAAAAVARATRRTVAELLPLLQDFEGLPHRLQRVAAAGDRTFYDDSKSTTPEAAQLAVDAFTPPSRVHLIAGGFDKRIDLAPISALAGRIAGLYGVGATGPAIVRAATAGHAEVCGTVDRAVRRALERMGPNDVLLLSPGCASWDQFENYEARGRAFARTVEESAADAIA